MKIVHICITVYIKTIHTANKFIPIISLITRKSIEINISVTPNHNREKSRKIENGRAQNLRKRAPKLKLSTQEYVGTPGTPTEFRILGAHGAPYELSGPRAPYFTQKGPMGPPP